MVLPQLCLGPLPPTDWQAMEKDTMLRSQCKLEVSEAPLHLPCWVTPVDTGLHARFGSLQCGVWAVPSEALRSSGHDHCGVIGKAGRLDVIATMTSSLSRKQSPWQELPERHAVQQALLLEVAMWSCLCHWFCSFGPFALSGERLP